MGQEYKLDEIFSILKKEEYMDNLVSDADLFYAVHTYFTKDPESFANAVLKDEESDKLIERIMSLYPMSNKVVEIIVDRKDNLTKNGTPSDELISLFDIGNLMISTLKYFMNRSNDIGRTMEKKQSDYANFLEVYEKKEAELLKKRSALEESEKKNSENHRKLKKLEEEVNKLQEEWGEAEIAKKIGILEKKKQKLERQKHEAEKTVRDISTELSSVENSDSAFNTAVNALKEAISKCLEDVSE